MARGWAEVRVERQTVRLVAGDLLVLDPGETHTFLGTSADYFHFVLHVPGLPPAEARADRIVVPRTRLL